MQKQKVVSQENDNTWYRNAMVWLVILLPLTVVVASMVTIYIAHKHAPQIAPSTSHIFQHEPEQHS